MSAYPDKKDHFSNTFCLVIAWMEASHDDVYILEADDTNGRLALIGMPADCQAFQQECAEIISGTPDPDELWRTY
jgi:hypothetical protein